MVNVASPLRRRKFADRSRYDDGCIPGTILPSAPCPLTTMNLRILPNSYRRSESGVTLVEVLTVMSVVGILAAVLLPGLGRARKAAQGTVCQNNLHQWALAQTMYAGDNAEVIARESFEPNGVTLNLWGEVNDPRSDDVWYRALKHYINVSAYDYVQRAKRGDFYRNKVFHCPSARFPVKKAAQSEIFFSLAMNSQLILLPNPTMKLSEVRETGSTVMFLENRLAPEPKVVPEQIDDNLGQPSAFANRFGDRHQGGGGFSFCDGHTEVVKGTRVVNDLGFAFFPPTGVIWTADPTRNPND